jgi:hypothetical protein
MTPMESHVEVDAAHRRTVVPRRIHWGRGGDSSFGRDTQTKATSSCATPSRSNRISGRQDDRGVYGIIWKRL